MMALILQTFTTQKGYARTTGETIQAHAQRSAVLMTPFGARLEHDCTPAIGKQA